MPFVYLMQVLMMVLVAVIVKWSYYFTLVAYAACVSDAGSAADDGACGSNRATWLATFSNKLRYVNVSDFTGIPLGVFWKRQMLITYDIANVILNEKAAQPNNLRFVEHKEDLSWDCLEKEVHCRKL